MDKIFTFVVNEKTKYCYYWGQTKILNIINLFGML